MISISTAINCESFFQLNDPLTSRFLRLSVRDYSDWITSEQAWGIYKGQIEINRPIRLGAYRGGQAADFLWSDLVALYCVSARVIKILDTNNLTGWRTYPVEVFGKNGKPLPGYYGFSVLGKECKRDRSCSEIITKPAPTPTGKQFQVYKGLYFDETEWDGSDFFFVHKNIEIVTQKVRDLFASAKVSNVQLIPQADVEIDVYLDQYD